MHSADRSYEDRKTNYIAYLQILRELQSEVALAGGKLREAEKKGLGVSPDMAPKVWALMLMEDDGDYRRHVVAAAVFGLQEISRASDAALLGLSHWFLTFRGMTKERLEQDGVGRTEPSPYPSPLWEGLTTQQDYFAAAVVHVEALMRDDLRG